MATSGCGSFDYSLNSLICSNQQIAKFEVQKMQVADPEDSYWSFEPLSNAALLSWLVCYI